MGVKLLCKYCSVLFFVVAGCFCGPKFQLIGQAVLEKKVLMIDCARKIELFGRVRANRWKWSSTEYAGVGVKLRCVLMPS